jgi:glycosyltransferase involved in cell wall biosynthesis
MPVVSMYQIHAAQKKRIKNFWDFMDNAGRVGVNPTIQLGPYEGIKDAWKDKPCFVIGSGPSLKGFDLNRLNGHHTIGINHVIEDYNNFEWFIFLDQRFLNRTTYDLKQYKGRVFSQNTCQLLPGIDNVRYKTIKNVKKTITMNIEEGLFCGFLTGLAGLHLALISGANPIYLLGLDCGGGTQQDFHYKIDYTAASRGAERYKKYIGTAKYFDRFAPWKDRIINLSQASNITTFQKKPISECIHLNGKIKVISEPTICHVAVMNNIKEMGDISRHVFHKTMGRHVFAHIDRPMPMADIYFLECFINQSQKFVNFQRPHKKAKIISLIHSSSSCLPAIHSDKVITITEAWQKVIMNKKFNSVVIPGAIDFNLYKYPIDYSKKTFGRITRWSPGKVHPNFDKIAMRLLEKYKDSKCIMYSNNYKARIGHDGFIVDKSIKIDEVEKKAQKLSELTLFADMHNTFVETFSLALLEAMAAGLCIVLYSKNPQPAMEEVLGGCGVVCKTEQEFEVMLNQLLPDAQKKRYWGDLARKRAMEFSINRMVNSYNQLFRSLLNG